MKRVFKHPVCKRKFYYKLHLKFLATQHSAIRNERRLKKTFKATVYVTGKVVDVSEYLMLKKFLIFPLHEVINRE